MLTAKKQITSFGLLLLVALPLFFSMLSYVKQQYIKQQRRQRFRTELLETVTIKAEKVNWIENGKEIEVDGHMFDIESYKIKNDDIVFTGFYDYKEEKLVNHNNKVEQQKTKTNSPLNRLMIKLLFLPNYKEVETFSIQSNWRFFNSQFPVYAESITNMAYPAVAPPPKHC